MPIHCPRRRQNLSPALRRPRRRDYRRFELMVMYLLFGLLMLAVYAQWLGHGG